MTVEEAIARMRARWDHPPLSLVDVNERLALRLADRPDIGWTACRARNACRVFLRRMSIRSAAWRSRYVHSVREVDEVVDIILEELDLLEQAADRPKASRAKRRREAA